MANDHDNYRWDLGEELAGDRALMAVDGRLSGRRIALLLTGSIAAFRAPGLVRELRRAGAADVYVYATSTAMQFVARDALEWTSLHPVVTELDGRAQHVELQGVDAWLVAPATYSTINKVAAGVADNAVTTTLASALGLLEQGRGAVLFAPAMHGSMLNAICRQSLARLAELGCIIIPPCGRDGKALLPDDESLLAAVVAATVGR